MPENRRLRGLVALPAAALVASVLTVIGPAAAPATAAEPCVSEKPERQSRCDDTVAPETTLTSRTPAWTNATQVVLTFTGRHTDTDPDPIGFECQFYATPSAPATWSTCTSPATYPLPDETTAAPYTFRVRAVDTADHATNATASEGFDCLPLVCQRPDVDVPDADQTPETVQVRVDRTAPAGAVRAAGLADDENPRWPMVTSTDLRLVLSAGGSQDRSPVTFACTLDGRGVPCELGTTDLRRLAPGDHRFEALARDAAGNVDPTPAVLQFAVPRNLTAAGSSGWRTRRGAAYFGGDYLRTTKAGATVSVPARNVRELRLIAPRGPKLGKVQVRVGRGAWRTVDLGGSRYEPFHVYQLRDQFDVAMSGPILVRALEVGRGKHVRVDAVLGH